MQCWNANLPSLRCLAYVSVGAPSFRSSFKIPPERLPALGSLVSRDFDYQPPLHPPILHPAVYLFSFFERNAPFDLDVEAAARNERENVVKLAAGTRLRPDQAYLFQDQVRRPDGGRLTFHVPEHDDP